MHRPGYCFCFLCMILAAAIAAFLFLLPQPGMAAEPAAPAKAISFINDIAPIFQENCFGCHDSKKRKGKLDMSTFDALRKGGENDDPIVPGKPEESLLLDLVKSKSAKRMPPPKESPVPLAKEKIALLERWIKEGAKIDVAGNADLRRELRIRWKPPQPFAVYPAPTLINSLAFTPDNKKLVVGGHHELLIWDVDTMKLEKRIATRCSRALAMLFLPDGKLVVAGDRPGLEGDVRIYDINGGAPKVENGVAMLDGVNDPAVMIKELVSTDDSMMCLSASADGKKLAAGGWDRLVRVWDLSAGYAAPKLEQQIENHADWVSSVALAPDGKHLLTASHDKTAKVWDLVAKESVLTFPDHQQPVTGVAVKADSKIGYSVGEDGALRTWNSVGDGKMVRASPGHSKPVQKLIMHPSKPLLATCSADMTVRLWNADNGGAVATLSGHTDHVFAIAFSPDGELLASGSANGEVKIWKVADPKMPLKAFNATPGLVAVAPPK